jgi:hypothetical protein
VKQSGWIRKMALTALMTLAVILVWPPIESEAASSNDHVAITASHSQHHAHAEEISPQRVLHVTLDADCQPSAIGCCMMIHCHPGISVVAHEMTTVVASDEPTIAGAPRRSGSDPAVNLPPPRRLSL